MSITAIVRALVSAGASPEMILAAVEAAEQEAGNAINRRRANDAERQQRVRDRKSHVTSRDVTVTNVTSRDTPPSPASLNDPEYNLLPLVDNLNPSPPSPPIVPPAPKMGARSSVEFENFWKAYPKREGSNPKQPALKAFCRAVSGGATAPAIIAGAVRLAAEHAGKDPRFIPQAVTWLNQRRFEDVTESQCQTGPPAEPVRQFDNDEDFDKWWKSRRQQSEAIQ